MGSDREKGQRLLLADSDVTVRDQLGEFLSDLGYQVDIALTTDQLLSMGCANRYAVVLVDSNIADRSMDDILNTLLGGDVAPGIVMMSSDARLQTVLTSFRRGVADFVVKPFDISDLQRIVMRAATISNVASRLMSSGREDLFDGPRTDAESALAAGRLVAVADGVAGRR